MLNLALLLHARAIQRRDCQIGAETILGNGPVMATGVAKPGVTNLDIKVNPIVARVGHTNLDLVKAPVI